MNFTIYDNNGRILSNGSCMPADFELQLANHPPGCGILEGTWHWDTHRIDLSGEDPVAIAIPPRPSPHHTFDWVSKLWIDPRMLDDHKEAKWAEIKAARDAAEYGPFVWDGSVFDGTVDSQRRIAGKVQEAFMCTVTNTPFSEVWTLADNTTRALTAQDMIAVGVALAANISTVFATGRALRAQIDAALTPGEVATVTWPQE